MGFPAKRISTALNWEDAVLPYYVREELEEINNWITVIESSFRTGD